MEKLTKYNIKSIQNIPGIYRIINTVNNKCYIGKSIHLKRRLQDRINRYQKDLDKVLYKAINKYGIQEFYFEILFQSETISEDDLFLLEQQYIKQFDSFKNGYNTTLGGEGISGKVYTEEEREICRQRYLNNSALLIQSENCKKQTYSYNIKTKEYKTFNSEVDAANYLIQLGYKSSKSQISKVVVGKYKAHHEHIFALSKEDLNTKINNYFTKQPKLKIDYFKFYNQLVNLSDEFGVLPTIDRLVVILNIPHTNISRRIQYLKKEGKLTTIQLLDTKRIVIIDKVKDFDIFKSKTKVTNLITGTYKIFQDEELADILNYKLSSIITFRNNNKVIKNKYQLSTYVGYLEYINNKQVL